MDYFILGFDLCPIQEVLSQDDSHSRPEPVVSWNAGCPLPRLFSFMAAGLGFDPVYLLPTVHGSSLSLVSSTSSIYSTVSLSQCWVARLGAHILSSTVPSLIMSICSSESVPIMKRNSSGRKRFKFINNCYYLLLGTGERAQWVKNLLHKQEDPSSGPQPPCKGWAHTYVTPLHIYVVI